MIDDCDSPSISTTEHPAIRQDEACGFLTFFFHHMKSSQFFGRAWASARDDGGGRTVHAGPAKGREQLSRVVTVRWYPVSSSAAGVRIRKKG